MKYDVAMEWVEALRSGEYKQSHRMLHTNQGFCCLGVLCDISKLGVWDERGSSFDYKIDCDDFCGANLPKAVMNWAEMRSIWGDNFNANAVYERALYEMNDFDGKTFEEIADYIEKNWKYL